MPGKSIHRIFHFLSIKVSAVLPSAFWNLTEISPPKVSGSPRHANKEVGWTVAWTEIKRIRAVMFVSQVAAKNRDS